MKVIRDLRVLKAIIRQSKLTTNNYELIVNKKYKYLDSGYIITPVKYKGKKYVSRYTDGCFCPYIVELN